MTCTRFYWDRDTDPGCLERQGRPAGPTRPGQQSPGSGRHLDPALPVLRTMRCLRPAGTGAVGEQGLGWQDWRRDRSGVPGVRPVAGAGGGLRQRREAAPAVIIVLNGTSSAGKTTLGKALQDILPTPYLLIGIDTVVFALPRRYVDELWTRELCRYEYDGDRIAKIVPLPRYQAMVRGLHASVASLAGAGLDVIMDHCLVEPAWADDLLAAFAGLDLLRVGVVCPLAVVEERERSRGDRTLGWASAHYDVIHRYLPYDLTVDTSRADPSGCAEAVVAELARRFRPSNSLE